MNRNKQNQNQAQYQGAYPHGSYMYQANGYPSATNYSAQQSGYSAPQTTGGQAPAAAYQNSSAPYNGQEYYMQNQYAPQPYQTGGQQHYFQSNAQSYPQNGQAASPFTAANAYAQQPQPGGYPQQSGYPRQNEYPQGNGFPPQGGYNQGAGYQQGVGTQYPYSNQRPAQTGSYIPQTPNYQQSYSENGNYQAPGGYAQPYNAYTQMGRTPQMPPQGMLQETGGQVPLNGGGYVPQPVPVRRKPFEMNDALLLIAGGVLLLVFILGVFVPGLSFLKWIFLLLAVASAVILWVKPMVANNKRISYTIVFGILTLVLLTTTLTQGAGSTGSLNSDASGSGTDSRAQATAPAPDGQETAQVVSVSTESPTATPAPQEDDSVMQRCANFFAFWHGNQQNDMLSLCAPSWRDSVENPRNELFMLLANRFPRDYSIEGVSGTSYDMSRTVSVVSLMDRNNGKDPVRYRLSVIMVKEGDEWYVDPKSLKTYDEADTPDPNVTATPGPTATPAVYPDTPLYYNPDGGSYYHLDQNCQNVGKKYLPLKGHFTYSQINDDQYKDLQPCSVCGAPLREE